MSAEKEEIVNCSICARPYPRSSLLIVTDEDTQGYFASGALICPSCLSDIRCEAFQVEDEDVYDIEGDDF